MLRLRRSVVVEDGVNESRGSVVSHPETNFNRQFVGEPFPHHVFVNKPSNVLLQSKKPEPILLASRPHLGGLLWGGISSCCRMQHSCPEAPAKNLHHAMPQTSHVNDAHRRRRGEQLVR